MSARAEGVRTEEGDGLGQTWNDDFGRADIHLQMSWLTTLRSIVLLALVGLFSGLFPAIKASRMNPIEALRYE